MAKITMTHAEWRAEAEKRFGPDPNDWRFVCPCCKHEASVMEWKNAGAMLGEFAFSCIGRRLGAKREAFSTANSSGPCNYAGGGLIGLNPVRVVFPDGKEIDSFAFADPPDAGQKETS